MNVERRFDPDHASVPAVRRFVADVVAELPEPVASRVLLIVSEIATNAVLHAKSDFTVGIVLDPSMLRLEVCDHAAGKPEMRPILAPTDIHGRGLRIVDHFAQRWGTTPCASGPGKSLWVEIDLAR